MAQVTNRRAHVVHNHEERAPGFCSQPGAQQCHCSLLGSACLCGVVGRVLDSESGGPGFKPRPSPSFSLFSLFRLFCPSISQGPPPQGQQRPKRPEKGRKSLIFGPKLHFSLHNLAIFGARTVLKPVSERAGRDPGRGHPETAVQDTFCPSQGSQIGEIVTFIAKLG